MNTYTNTNQQNTPVSMKDYVFRDQQQLPVGQLKLKIMRGHAWVFTETENFIMHSGEERTICTHNNAPRIRSAYDRGFALYNLK